MRTYGKLAQKKYKTKPDLVWNMFHPELSKKLKFDHMNKCEMRNPESVRENEILNVLLDFEIQTNHLISARRPDLVIINKK